MKIKNLYFLFILSIPVFVHFQETNAQLIKKKQIQKVPLEKTKDPVINKKSGTSYKTHTDINRDTIFFENFDDNNNWDKGDAREFNGKMWRISDFNSYEGDKSWWCGHPLVGGYLSEWYQTLTTPEIDLNSTHSPALEFMHFYAAEYDSTVPPEENLWDGCHVRISTDEGITYELITPEGGYDAPDSLYVWQFHYENIPGGMPGWHGFSDGWEKEIFELSDFTGLKVKLRFIFASDVAVDVLDSAIYVGWFLDNIKVVDGETELFADEGEDNLNTELVTGEGSGRYPEEGWKLTQSDAFSPPNSWNCDDDPLDNVKRSVLVSPPIDIPNVEGDMLLSYNLFNDVPDFDGNNNNWLEDYYMVDVQYLGNELYEGIWYNMFFDWSRSTIGSDTGWVKMAEGKNANGSCQIDDFAKGKQIQLRWYGRFDQNNDGGNGNGVFIDDVLLYHEYNPTVEPDLLWSFFTLGDIVSSPAIGEDGTIYIGSTDEKLYALTPDGNEKWSVDVGGKIQSTPAIDENCVIYVTTTNGKICAIDESGNIEWVKTPQPIGVTDEIYASPALSGNGKLYFPIFHHYLVAYNSSGGELGWWYTGDVVPAGPGVIDYSSPAIGKKGRIYFGSRAKQIYAVIQTFPTPYFEWTKSTFGWAGSSSPAIGTDNEIYICDYSGRVYSISKPENEVKTNWVYNADDRFYMSSHVLRIYPNPFSEKTTIQFFLKNHQSNVQLCVYNLHGTKVMELLDGAECKTGLNEIIFDGSTLPAGIYICKLSAGKFNATCRMILNK